MYARPYYEVPIWDELPSFWLKIFVDAHHNRVARGPDWLLSTGNCSKPLRVNTHARPQSTANTCAASILHPAKDHRPEAEGLRSGTGTALRRSCIACCGAGGGQTQRHAERQRQRQSQGARARWQDQHAGKPKEGVADPARGEHGAGGAVAGP